MSTIAVQNNTARVSLTQSKVLTNKRSGNKKSILKRPIPAQLPLSPTWHSASESTFPFRTINALLSPSNVAGPKSPHVHFPPTPSMTTSTISVYSPGTYDRGSAPTHNNSQRGTKRRTIPANIPTDVVQDENFKPTRASKVFRSLPASAIRFEPLALQSPVAVQSASPLSANVNTNEYPVSPYPYAAFPPSPLSASFFPVADKAAMPFSPREFVTARNKENGGRCHPIPSRVARKRGRRPAALNVPAVLMNPFRVFTPVVNIDVTLSPVIESAPDSGVVSDNESSDTRLSSAFWKSVSLIDLNEDETKVDGCAYPLSALAMQDALEADLVSASNTTSNMIMKRNLDLNLDLDLTSPVDENMDSPAPVLFGRADGTLWSPGLPVRSAVSTASTEMTMYTASAGYSASAAMFSPLPSPPMNVVHSFSAHRASFGQRMGAVSRMGFNLPDTLNVNEGINSPAPFRGNPMTSPSSDAFVSITSPALQSPSVMFGSMAMHHGLGFTSPSPMGEAFPSFAVAAEKMDKVASTFEVPSLGFPAKALIGGETVEGRSRVINAL